MLRLNVCALPPPREAQIPNDLFSPAWQHLLITYPGPLFPHQWGQMSFKNEQNQNTNQRQVAPTFHFCGSTNTSKPLGSITAKPSPVWTPQDGVCDCLRSWPGPVLAAGLLPDYPELSLENTITMFREELPESAPEQLVLINAHIIKSPSKQVIIHQPQETTSHP